MGGIRSLGIGFRAGSMGGMDFGIEPEGIGESVSISENEESDDSPAA
jgi:hypothetical protein